jgi:hypothetical protein
MREEAMTDDSLALLLTFNSIKSVACDWRSAHT